MYLKNKALVAFKIKNIILFILSVFQIAVLAYLAVDLLIYYRDDIDTALNAKSMPGSIRGIIVGAIVLLIVCISRKLIGDARFYSSYFEGDLSGTIPISALAEVTGHSQLRVRLELRLFRILYMKKFSIKTIDGVEQVELFSKKILCECKNCGAGIEKKLYFTGQCPYCGSPDIFAKVLSGDRFYSISNEIKQGVNRPSYYEGRGLASKYAASIILIIISIAAATILTIMSFDMLGKYNDQDYLRKAILAPETKVRSFSAIKADLLSTALFGVFFTVIMVILFIRRVKSARCIRSSGAFAAFFAKFDKPFIKAEELQSMDSSKSGKISKVRGSIRQGYLNHCTLEVHDSVLKIALAKKIVKDHCPSCASPINGAVDENYVCKYCGNKIMDVVVKK
ncbi:MAG: hypothetical protein IKD90_08380 [Clostridiales bacterium]|nr:hypothetical protein [Clostridiales bacterium]